MFELGVRLLLSGLLIFVAGATDAIHMELAIEVSGALAIAAVLNHLTTRDGQKSDLSGTALALFDSVLLGIVLADSGLLQSFGILTLAPLALGIERFGRSTAYCAPLVAFGMVFANQMVHPGYHVPDPILRQAGAVFIVGLMIAIGAAIKARATENEPPPAAANEVLLVREQFRRLEDAYEILRQGSQRDRVLSSMAGSQAIRPLARAGTMIERLATATSLEGIVLYSVADVGQLMGVRAKHGTIPDGLADLALTIASDWSQSQIQERISGQLRRILSDHPFEVICLVHAGKIVGSLCLLHSDPKILNDAKRTVEATAPQLAAIISEAFERSTMERRIREAELLYSLASLARGCESTLDLCSRFADELADMTQADQAGIYIIEDGRALCLANFGGDARLIETMSFGLGPGIAGWTRVGMPELILLDVRSDDRAAKTNKRIGSYFVVPFTTSEFDGFVTIATTATCGLDLGSAETMRILVAELARAIDTIETDAPSGILSSSEMQTLMHGRDGSLAVFEILRRETIETQFGKSTYRATVRTFMRRVAAKAPPRSGVMRNEKGQIVVFIPEMTEIDASRWANEMTAVASMIGIRGPDSTKLPIAVRAKVAAFNPQNSRFSEKLVA